MKAMNMNKRILRILAITQCLLLLIWAVPAASASSGSYENATYLTFSDDSVTASGNSSSDYEIDGTDLTIKGEGTFVLSGSCSDGTVTVKKGVTDLILQVLTPRPLPLINRAESILLRPTAAKTPLRTARKTTTTIIPTIRMRKMPF